MDRELSFSGYNNARNRSRLEYSGLSRLMPSSKFVLSAIVGASFAMPNAFIGQEISNTNDANTAVKTPVKAPKNDDSHFVRFVKIGGRPYRLTQDDNGNSALHLVTDVRPAFLDDDQIDPAAPKLISAKYHHTPEGLDVRAIVAIPDTSDAGKLSSVIEYDLQERSVSTTAKKQSSSAKIVTAAPTVILTHQDKSGNLSRSTVIDQTYDANQVGQQVFDDISMAIDGPAKRDQLKVKTPKHHNLLVRIVQRVYRVGAVTVAVPYHLVARPFVNHTPLTPLPEFTMLRANNEAIAHVEPGVVTELASYATAGKPAKHSEAHSPVRILLADALAPTASETALQDKTESMVAAPFMMVMDAVPAYSYPLVAHNEFPLDGMPASLRNASYSPSDAFVAPFILYGQEPQQAGSTDQHNTTIDPNSLIPAQSQPSGRRRLTPKAAPGKVPEVNHIDLSTEEQHPTAQPQVVNLGTQFQGAAAREMPKLVDPEKIRESLRAVSSTNTPKDKTSKDGVQAVTIKPSANRTTLPTVATPTDVRNAFQAPVTVQGAPGSQSAQRIQLGSANDTAQPKKLAGKVKPGVKNRENNLVDSILAKRSATPDPMRNIRQQNPDGTLKLQAPLTLANAPEESDQSTKKPATSVQGAQVSAGSFAQQVPHHSKHFKLSPQWAALGFVGVVGLFGAWRKRKEEAARPLRVTPMNDTPPDAPSTDDALSQAEHNSGTGYNQQPLFSSVYPHENPHGNRVVSWAKQHAPEMLVGAGSGMAVRTGITIAAKFALAKLAFALPAAALAASPVATTIVSAAALGAATAGVTKIITTRIFHKEKMQEKNWAWTAFKTGSKYGAISGVVGAGIADIVKADGWLHHIFQHKTSGGAPVHAPVTTPMAQQPVATTQTIAHTPATPAFEHPAVATQAAPQTTVPLHTTTAPVDAAQTLAHADIKSLITADQLKSLSPALQKMAESHNPKDMLFFCSEASYKLLHTHYSDPATHAAAVKAAGDLMKRGLDVAQQNNLHGTIVKQLNANLAYGEAWGKFGLVQDKCGAVEHAKLAGDVMHGFKDRLMGIKGFRVKCPSPTLGG